MKEKVKMKILKAKTSHPNKEVFKISELTYNTTSTPMAQALIETLENNLNNPIEVVIHLKSDKVRYGSMGYPYIEKKYSVKKGSSRINYALENGYTHIEGIIVESYV